MRSFLGTILAPCIALAGIALLLFVPSPSELAMTLRPYGVEINTVEMANGSDTDETVAERIKVALGPALGAENTDCFDELRLADEAKLDRCGRLVYQALAEVNENPGSFTTDVAQATSPEMLVQELKLAATEVCRERWSREGSVPKDSPACQIALASVELDRN